MRVFDNACMIIVCNVRKKLEPIKHKNNTIMVSTTDLSKNALDGILIGNNAH